MEENRNIEFKDQKIIPVNMEGHVSGAFLDYAMSVLTSRALPDVRDGMKPGQRRILYAMYEDNLTSSMLTESLQRQSVTFSVDIILTVMPPCTARWSTWHRIFLSVTLLYRDRVTSVL